MNSLFKFLTAAGLLALSLVISGSANAQLLVDASSGTTLATSGDDFTLDDRSLGFTGSFFCAPTDTVDISSNGNLNFSGDDSFVNLPLPHGERHIDVLWDDQFLDGSAIIENVNPGVYYAVTWENMTTFVNSNARNTFQAVLFGANTTLGGINFQAGDIAFSYALLTGSNDDETTVGLDDGAGGAVVLPPSIDPDGDGVLSDADKANLPIYGDAGQVILFRPRVDPAECTYDVSIVGPSAVVPEPGALALLAGPLMVGVGLFAHRRRK